jgi:hypothetical protein
MHAERMHGLLMRSRIGPRANPMNEDDLRLALTGALPLALLGACVLAVRGVDGNAQWDD